MTDASAVEAVAVTQADREAALDLYLHTSCLSQTDYRAQRARQEFLDGSRDQWRTLQAFARHRLAAIPAASEGEAADPAEVWREAYVAVYGCEPTHAKEAYQAAYDVVGRAIASHPAPSDQEKLVGELTEVLELASSAIDEMFRYFDGGETRGSYDGKPERNQLRKAGYAIKPVLTRARQIGEQG